MRLRLLAAAAAASVSVVGASDAAVPVPQIVDAKGDAKGAQAGTDIESVLFARTKGGFTVTMTLGAPPLLQPGVLFRVFGTQSDCGDFKMSYAATLALTVQNQTTMTCGAASGTSGSPYTIVNITPKVVGNSLVWTIKTKGLPTEMRAGTMSELQAFVAVADPMTGILTTATFAPQSAIDHAVGTATFKY